MRRAGLIALLLCPVVVWACNVPVFRYALERWPAAPYEVVIFHRGPLPAPERAIVDALKDKGEAGKNLANFALLTVDLAALGNGPTTNLWARQTNAILPWMVVRFPGSGDEEIPAVWAGPLSAESAKLLVDSPARQEISRRLLEGDSAVWLLLDSGDPAVDDPAFKLLETELKKAEKSIQLPPADPDDPKMHADLPLRVAFSVLRASQRNPAEAMLTAMFRQNEPALATNTTVAAVPIFGRGRALAIVTGRDLSAAVINDACAFMAGACSCQVKELNPGFDLLLAADWEALLEGRVVKDPELPPLVGLSQAVATNKPALTLVATTAPSNPGGQGHLIRNLLLVLGLAMGSVTAATFFLKAKARNSRPDNT